MLPCIKASNLNSIPLPTTSNRNLIYICKYLQLLVNCCNKSQSEPENNVCLLIVCSCRVGGLVGGGGGGGVCVIKEEVSTVVMENHVKGFRVTYKPLNFNCFVLYSTKFCDNS